MRLKLILILLAGFIITSGYLISIVLNKKGEKIVPPQSSLSLTSPVFANNQPIDAKYTCKGENISPPLTIAGVPRGTKSLALIMHDPDAPGTDWVHWLLWNISPQATQIVENSLPAEAIEGTTSFGKPGYGGPCPPPGTGTHHYIFELYALAEPINLPSSADREKLAQALQSHSPLAKAKLTGLFSAE